MARRKSAGADLISARYPVRDYSENLELSTLFFRTLISHIRSFHASATREEDAREIPVPAALCHGNRHRVGPETIQRNRLIDAR